MGLAVALFLLQGIRSGLSTLLGGLAYWLPTLLFLWRVLVKNSARIGKQFIATFITGEILRLLLSAIMLVILAKYFPIKLTSLIIGFIGAIIAFWISSVVFLIRDEEVNS